jgi:transposase
LKPHLSQYWLNPKWDDPQQAQQQIEDLCACYLAAPQRWEEEHVHTVSTDEMTGIQALERIAPTKPTGPGRVERREFEYTRHGTQCLIASFDVVTGQIVAPLVQATRNEQDFLTHIDAVVTTDPGAGWVFVTDNLNTHCSESLVRYVAEAEGLEDDLGVKGKQGILKSMETRRQFLTNPSRRIRFVFTPKHSSWLNQIEIWFSILVRRVIKRGNFPSVEALRQRILDFIDYFNKTFAKPFKWTYTGRALNV